VSLGFTYNDHLDADHIRAALHGREREIVEAFYGSPNRALSNNKELRWHPKGSLALRLTGLRAGLWYDHAQERGGDIFELIKQEQGCDFVAALRFAQQFVGGGSAPRPSTPRIVRDDTAAAAEHDAEELRRIEQALGIWCAVQPLRGSLAEKYLKSRCIDVPDDALDVLGFHPACPFGGSTVPALVALVRDIITGEPIGIHRTRLSDDGRKLERPKLLGPSRGGAIKLSGESLISTELTIAEGIETALSAMMAGFRPTWSVIDAGGIAKFPVLPHIERLTIIVDNDASGTGQRDTAECRARWEAAGHCVRTVMPPTVGDDLNDVLQAHVKAQGNQQ
jgi:putative DNA primase/helicase